MRARAGRVLSIISIVFLIGAVVLHAVSAETAAELMADVFMSFLFLASIVSVSAPKPRLTRTRASGREPVSAQLEVSREMLGRREAGASATYTHSTE